MHARSQIADRAGSLHPNAPGDQPSEEVMMMSNERSVFWVRTIFLSGDMPWIFGRNRASGSCTSDSLIAYDCTAPGVNVSEVKRTALYGCEDNRRRKDPPFPSQNTMLDDNKEMLIMDRSVNGYFRKSYAG
ncbi:unnamed protein product [Nippostrongylus brasiliensis]|uniref:Sema domain-containing protein n=1 Tax=Nippostrongylus brasiliensis TaxID=27835 RepID=A0A0N4YR85_NIPBR|nr:unnamed protein product [Nippostrongylus brasiliensis]